MRYASRKYLAEKWEKLKWDMEGVILSDDDDDQVPQEDLDRCAYNIIEQCEAIAAEMRRNTGDYWE